MLLVVVNPRSGLGWAIHRYKDDARLMLNVASGIEGHNILITTRAGHATERMREVVWLYLSFLFREKHSSVKRPNTCLKLGA